MGDLLGFLACLDDRPNLTRGRAGGVIVDGRDKERLLSHSYSGLVGRVDDLAIVLPKI
jgi:hypothetical protein